MWGILATHGIIKLLLSILDLISDLELENAVLISMKAVRVFIFIGYYFRGGINSVDSIAIGAS